MDWAAFFWAYAQARDPDPKLVGDTWKSIWLNRLNHMPFLATPWITNQTRNDYWKHGSVCEDYSKIKIPVYAIGGWADNYRNTVFTLLSHLTVPKKDLLALGHINIPILLIQIHKWTMLQNQCDGGIVG